VFLSRKYKKKKDGREESEQRKGEKRRGKEKERKGEKEKRGRPLVWLAHLRKADSSPRSRHPPQALASLL
jgi:hypothetical protein